MISEGDDSIFSNMSSGFIVEENDSYCNECGGSEEDDDCTCEADEDITAEPWEG